MRMPFGGNGGMGGGGGMLRTVHRAVRAGVGGGSAQEPVSHSATSTATATSTSSSTAATTTEPSYKSGNSNLLSLSSLFTPPISAALPTCSSPTQSDGFDWECVDGIEDERSSDASNDDFLFGSVPSNDEVQHAVFALQQVLDPTYFSQLIKGRLAYNSEDVAEEIASPTGMGNRVSSVGRELDWIEPSLHLFDPRMSRRLGSDRVYDAFHLLHTDPSIQRMVMSISSDKDVWDAVLNNEVVRELRESLIQADHSVPENLDDCSDGSNAAMDVLGWIFNNTKAKVMELIEKITKLVKELFRPPQDEKTAGGATDPLVEKLQTSFMLSIVVLLIVVVGRARTARPHRS